MEVVEPALQKKYHKITGISRGNSFSASSASESSSSPSISTFNTVPSSSKNIASATLTTKLSSQTGAFQRDETAAKINKTESKNEPTNLAVPSSARNKNMSTLKQKAQQVIQSSKNAEAITLLSNRNAIASNQPLNLTSDSISTTVPENLNKRPLSFTASSSATSSGIPITQPLVIETSSQPSTHQNHHPQNPERSIIKSLLLNSRGLAVPTTGEGEDAVYTCPLCKISFRSADNLQYHTKCYCQGTPPVSAQSPSPHSAPISPVGSPSHKYFRSNSFNLCLPEKYSPNTLAKLASSSIRHHRTPLSLAKLAAQQTGYYYNKSSSIAALATSSGITGNASSSRNRPDNINIANVSNSSISVPSHTSTQSVSSQCVQITKQLIDASLPSPGPLLGKTRLVDTYNTGVESKREDAIVSNYATITSNNIEVTISEQDTCSTIPKNITKFNSSDTAPSPPIRKRSRRDSYAHSPPLKGNTTSSDNLHSPKNPRLQMCGGEMKIFERKGDTTPRFGLSGGSIISISPSPDSLSEPSPIGIRAGLLSGGSIIETPTKRASSSSISPSLPTPDHLTPHSAITTEPVMSGQKLFFQFPPVNAITAFNPLTLQLNTNEPNKIFHGGKFINHVPGMPGPNTLAPIVSMRSPSPVRKKLILNSPVAVRPMPIQQSTSSHSPFLMVNKIPQPPTLATSPKLSPKGKTFSLTKSITIPEPDEKRAAISAFSDMVNRSPSISGNYGNPGFPYMQMTPVWSASGLPSTKLTDANKKSFNFTRIADNLSPSRTSTKPTETTPAIINSNSSKAEVNCFNFENLIPKPEVIIRSSKQRTSEQISPLHIDVSTSTTLSCTATTIPTLVLPTNTTTASISTCSTTLSCSPTPLNARSSPNADQTVDAAPKFLTKPTKFLRPSSLPLKPGTFTPKRHHGITPTANTLPLISPETPRPSKACIQLYLNGHAYTYLGLKCSTKTFYCTVNRQQPHHFTNKQLKQPISIYSNWQVCAESNPHPLGLSPKEVMSLYDSRQRLQQYRRYGKYTVANSSSKCTTLHSQSLICTALDTINSTSEAEENDATTATATANATTISAISPEQGKFVV